MDLAKRWYMRAAGMYLLFFRNSARSGLFWYIYCLAQQHKRAMQRLTELNNQKNPKGKGSRPTRHDAQSECVVMWSGVGKAKIRKSRRGIENWEGSLVLFALGYGVMARKGQKHYTCIYGKFWDYCCCCCCWSLMALLNVTFILSHIIVYRCITSVRLDGVWTKRNTIAIVEVGYEFETGSKDERIWIGTNHDGIDSQAERSKLSPI